jgi:hypothetical protein
MVKKRVITFFAVFALFVATLLALQAAMFGRIAGFALFESDSASIKSTQIPNTFTISLSSFEKKGDYLAIALELEEHEGKSKTIDISYELYDQQNTKITQANQKIFIEENSKGKYQVSIPIPANVYGNLVLKTTASDGSSVQTSQQTATILPTPSNRITSYATTENFKKLIPNLATLLVGILLVLLTLKFLTNHHRRTYHEISKNTLDRKLIRLDLP